MERIFTYLAALVSRFLFFFHAAFLIWWVSLVLKNETFWWFGILLSMLFIETAVTVFYRKGHEYYWFCPSIFIFTVTEIPCFWLLRLQQVECMQKNSGNGITCSTPINGTSPLGQIFKISGSDETRLSILDQTFVLLLVVGRWMLPKGEISRDQLSSLLLVYIATAADIVELTEIYEESGVGDNNHLVRALMTVWSMSLFQFCFTIMAVETKEKDREEMEEQALKELTLSNERKQTLKRNQVAPALYTHKVAQKKAMAKQKERLNTLQLKLHREEGDIQPETVESAQVAREKTLLGKVLDILRKVEKVCRKNLNLIQLLTPMLLQDLPFLIVRLVLVSYYKVTGSGTFLFLTAKNALLVMLQVYRICVLYCQPPDEEHDLFQEDDLTRLRSNVQTATTSVQGTANAIRWLARFRRKSEPKEQQESIGGRT